MNIIEPTLILDTDKCLSNIRSILKKAEDSGVIFRPHFKTHNSLEIGKWFREEGVGKITVSSVRMAEYFAEGGWSDITIALTFNIHETGKVNELIRSGKRINLTIDSPETLKSLLNKLNYPAHFFLKIDTGYNRTGIMAENFEEISSILFMARGSKLKFSGFLTHSGHSYRAGTKEEIIDIFNDTKKKMSGLKKRFVDEYPDLLISVGDTPTISIVPELKGVDEIRPGNFVFYDLMQHALGSCTSDKIAVIMAAPVISRNEDRKEIVIYGGAVHLSKEFITDNSGERNYGHPVLLNSDGWGDMLPGSRITSMSQEHSVISADDVFFKSVSIGDMIGIVPVHSCLAANLAGHYRTVDGLIISKNRY
ncbi:MAG: alanine racemase [Acidobacteriota bacterium]